VRSEVFTAVLLKIQECWKVTLSLDGQFNPEDDDAMLLRKVGRCTPKDTASLSIAWPLKIYKFLGM
jgi:hypothetical protein